MLKLADLANRADFKLGPLRVSPARRTIHGPRGESHVEPLIMQVFILLVEANGAVVTRSRLFDECWGGVNVGDYSLNRAITMVRRIAIETGPGAFKIENIPRTGYRLLANGQVERDLGATSSLRLPAAIGSVLSVIVGLGALAWWLIPASLEAAVAVSPQDKASSELADSIEGAAITSAAFYEAPMKLARRRQMA